MNKDERIAKIVKLVEKSPEGIKSRKKFHKLVYLLQEKGEDFDQNFIFHNYGVFSPTLAGDLDDAVESEYLSEQEKKSNDFNQFIYLKGSKEFNTELVYIENTELVENLVTEEPRLLEVLSTIVYLDRFHYEGKELRSKLHDLKPGLSNHYEKAFQMANELYQISEEPES